MRRELEVLIGQLGLAERVTLVGTVPQTELKTYYSAADALVLASSREGWANVLLESMACGTPVVATKVSGTPEVVTDPAAGVIVDKRTPEDIAKQVRLLFQQLPAPEATRAFAAKLDWGDVAAGQYEVFCRALNRVPCKQHDNAAQRRMVVQ